jgi:hypothetical protein
VVTSLARTRANRRNALFSSGPKTSTGKARSSKNGRRHGLLSAEVVLPDESSAEFEALRRGLIGSLGPVGQLEQAFAERVVVCSWRLHRLGRIESGLFIDLHYEELAGRARRDASRCVTDGVQPSP